VDEDEIASWLGAADQIAIPFDTELNVTAQSEGFTRYRRWDFRSTHSDHYPLLMHYPYYLLYSSQIVKQADLIFATYLFGDHFEFDQKQRDFSYYEAITVRDSSLSAAIQAIVAAEVGHLDLAYDYLRESAFIDLHDRAGNTKDGVHLASLAGAWLAAVAGLGGMRDSGETLSFAPRLPGALTKLCFRLMFRGRCIELDVGPRRTRYSLCDGDPVELIHHGSALVLEPGAPQTLENPPAPTPLPASPPPGRQPLGYKIGANGNEPHLQSDLQLRGTAR
jgi:alpha,alpha-trehalose phosphorylase